QAVALEARRGRPLMSSFHAFFSLGGFAAAGASSLLFALGLSPPVTALALAVAMAAGLAASPGALLPHAPGEAASSPPLARPTGALLALAALAFLGILGEEAMTDWSTVFLRFSRAVDEAAAATGFTAFSAAMTVGRLAGDWLVHRFGAVRVIRFGALLA